MPKRDGSTIDMFAEFEPAPVVARFDASEVRGATMPMLTAAAIARTLKDHPHGREAVAAAMTDYLGESISKAMLDKYASVASEAHTIPAHRLVALCTVTRDHRALNALLADAGLIAVPARYEALIRREVMREAQDKLARQIEAADAQWKAGGR